MTTILHENVIKTKLFKKSLLPYIFTNLDFGLHFTECLLKFSVTVEIMWLAECME